MSARARRDQETHPTVKAKGRKYEFHPTSPETPWTEQKREAIRDTVARHRLSGVERLSADGEEGQGEREPRGQAIYHRAVYGHGARQRQFILAG